MGSVGTRISEASEFCQALVFLFLQRGFEFTHEAVRDWEAHFALLLADQLRIKLSGRVALAAQIRELGYELEKEQLNQAFEMAKLLLGKKKVLEELDMRYIAETAIHTTTVVELGNT